MILKFNASQFCEALGVVAKVVKRSSINEILGNVLMTVTSEHVRLEATDNSLHAIAYILEPQPFADHAVTAFDPKRALTFLGPMANGELEVVVPQDRTEAIRFSVKGSRCSLNQVDTIDAFPTFQKLDHTASFQIAGEDFLKLIDQGGQCFEESDALNRFTLTGIHLTYKDGLLKVESCNAAYGTIAKLAAPGSGEADVIVDPKSLATCLRIANDGKDIDVRFVPGRVEFHGETYGAACPIMAGKFPDLSRISRGNPATVFKVNRKEFLAGLSSAQACLHPESSAVDFDVRQGDLKLSTLDRGAGDSEVHLGVETTGSDNLFTLAYRLASVVLKACPGDDAEFFYDPSSPMVFVATPQNADWLGMIATMRLEDSRR